MHLSLLLDMAADAFGERRARSCAGWPSGRRPGHAVVDPGMAARIAGVPGLEPDGSAGPAPAGEPDPVDRGAAVHLGDDRRVPERVEFRDELPYSETGKLLRRAIRADLTPAV
ncbi:MAG: hypothetical protein OJJ54_24435 [Pseudonocardia sp.]|nr:hypothetical protein [Pseudonocardia sp.]